MLNTIAFSFVAMLSLVLFSCAEKRSSEQFYNEIKHNKLVKIHSCDAYASLNTPLGKLQNNVWNSHSAENYPWEQCIGEMHRNGLDQYGWIWNWPEAGKTVYAQPQITLGYSPWLDHDSVIDNFPIPVDHLDSLVIEYDVDMLFEGDLNLTSTLWITDSETINRLSDKNSIKV